MFSRNQLSDKYLPKCSRHSVVVLVCCGEQVLGAMKERLMDFEEKVRSAAIAAICEAASKDLQA